MIGKAALGWRGRRVAGMVGGWLVACMVALWVAAPAQAAFGELFGAWPINGHPDAIESVAALPGVEHAFWAGGCDRGAAPALGQDMSGLGGVGARPGEILAPATNGEAVVDVTPGHVLVASPATADHCLDWGALARYTTQPPEFGVWQNIPWPVSPLPASGEIGQLEPEGDYEPAWRLPAATEAGSHPDATTMLMFNRDEHGVVDGAVDNIVVDVPPGFSGNPQAVPFCTNEQFAARPLQCPPQSQVGVVRLAIEGFFGAANIGNGHDTTYPLYNLEPRKGRAAELGFGYASGEALTAVRLVARVRSDEDFGITAFAGQIPAALSVLGQSVTLWGVPWAAANDIWRAKLGQFENDACNHQSGLPNAPQYIPPGGLAAGCRAAYEPGWGPIRPFLSAETDCNLAPTVRLAIDSYQDPGPFDAAGHPALLAFPQLFAAGESSWRTYASTSPAVTGCADLPFAPDLELAATSAAADAASGMRVELALPQNNDPPAAVADDPGREADDPAYDPADGAPGHWRSPAGRATAHLKDSVVRLPAGVALNPSAARGLVGCTDAGVGVRGFDSANGRVLFNDGDPFDGDGAADGADCPHGSIVGLVRVRTPVLADDLLGELVLAQPRPADIGGHDEALGYRVFLVVRSRERGVIAKLAGTGTADPATGQLTSRFDNAPELAFEHVTVDLKGGARGLLALPGRCATHASSSTFVPWSDGPPVADPAAVAVTAGCAERFAPTLNAGTIGRRARTAGTLVTHIGRRQGDQQLAGVQLRLAPGLLASVRGVPLCTDAQAAAAACPAATRIGSVDAAAGSGDPFVLERRGDVYLTESYKGAPYGLLTHVPVQAGPFRGPLALESIAVRQALHVDRRNGQVTAISDPLPTIWHGIPLRVRDLVVTVDRPNFVQNPSNCDPMAIHADMTSDRHATATATSPYQAVGCARLPFRPKLRLALTGRRQTKTGRHPGVRATVRQRRRQAAIARARVALPRTLALDPANAQALCEFDDGNQPDPENHCPPAAIIGRARATSPLLNRPLRGPVYFVKNIRTDPRTGNPIRTLPKIVAALRGEIAINLHGTSNVDRRNRLLTTFTNLPDAPVNHFAMRIKGGRNGILTVTRTPKHRINLCTRRQTAHTHLHAHNNRNQTHPTPIKTPCPKHQHRRRRH